MTSNTEVTLRSRSRRIALGCVLAVLATLAPGTTPESAADVWTQIGSDIEGILIDERSGWSVSTSADGSVVAIGAYYGGGGNSGQVRVFA